MAFYVYVEILPEKIVVKILGSIGAVTAAVIEQLTDSERTARKKMMFILNE